MYGPLRQILNFPSNPMVPVIADPSLFSAVIIHIEIQDSQGRRAQAPWIPLFRARVSYQFHWFHHCSTTTVLLCRITASHSLEKCSQKCQMWSRLNCLWKPLSPRTAHKTVADLAFKSRKYDSKAIVQETHPKWAEQARNAVSK